MRRLAFCSPLNPQPSGISDYSEELLPFLGQYVEIDLFVEGGVIPTNAALRQALSVFPLSLLEQRHGKQPYDAVVYHMGNSPMHTAIYENLMRVPGVVVLHDWILHHFKLGYAAARNQLLAYRALMGERYGRAGIRTADRMLRGQLSDAVFRMPLNEDVLAAARGVIGHSHFIIEQVRKERPALPSALAPMGVPLPALIPPAAARQALGLPPTAPIWASFGHVNPYKRIEPALRAFRSFRAEHPEARYLLVGSVSPNYPLQAIIERSGVAEAVTVTGHVPSAAFAHYVAATDLCLNLRYPTAGETSASLLRLLGAARPTLVSAVDAFMELPDAACAKVDVDRTEADLILQYARLFNSAPEVAQALGQNARDYVAAHHTLEKAARGYITFLSKVYGWEPPDAVRAPLWSLVTTEAATALPADNVNVIQATTAPFPALEGLGPALAEVGVTADDRAVLEDVARVVKDLLG